MSQYLMIIFLSNTSSLILMVLNKQKSAIFILMISFKVWQKFHLELLLEANTLFLEQFHGKQMVNFLLFQVIQLLYFNRAYF